MDEARAREFVKQNHAAVIATIKRDGRPQLSNVSYYFDGDGAIKVSITKTRAKYHNLVRDPRVSLECLDLSNWWGYVVVEGTAAFIDDERTLPELRRYYKNVRGEDHPDWEEYDQAMKDEQRVLLVFHPEKFYGALR